MNKNLTWAITTFLIVAMVCGTLIWINYNSWTFKFEMDDNTKEAIESIEYPIVNEGKNYVKVCNLLNDSTGYCGESAINPYVIEIYGECEYNFVFVEVNE